MVSISVPAPVPVRPATVLLTGFEPFDAELVNPSWEAARALGGGLGDEARIHVRQVPCVFGAAMQTLRSAVAELAPALVICIGQAGGRSEISIERVAINIDDGRIADNAGCQPIDTAVVAGGPAAYFSTLPIKAIVRALREAGLPASISNSAGTFVCNHLFYGLMHLLAAGGGAPGARGGFVHIPYLPAQAMRHAGQPSMALETLIAGLRIVIATALAVQQDIAETGGRLD